MKDKVRNVHDTSTVSSSTTSSTPTATSITGPPSVKRIFNLAETDELSSVPLTTVYEMEGPNSDVCSVADSDWWCRTVQHFDMYMSDEEQEVIECPLNAYECYDLTMFDAYEADREWVEHDRVRGVQTNQTSAVQALVKGSYYQVVLDSGADLSVMPKSWLEAGYGTASTSGMAVRMMDAQGGVMPNFGSRTITLDLGQACFQEVFHASDVDAPLLSLGRLLKKGWSLAHRNNMLHLCNDAEEVEIPVSFKRNSLIVDAQVFAVQAMEPSQGPGEDSFQNSSSAGDEPRVQALDKPRIIVQTSYNIHAQGPEWNFLECGDPCVLTWGKVRHDPSDVVGIHLWQYRTTLFCPDAATNSMKRTSAKDKAGARLGGGALAWKPLQIPAARGLERKSSSTYKSRTPRHQFTDWVNPDGLDQAASLLSRRARYDQATLLETGKGQRLVWDAHCAK